MSNQHIELTAVGQGYYRVFVDGIERSKHIAEREASESAGKLKRANPASSVYYNHDYHVRVDLVNAPVVVPPEPEPTPEPEPPVIVDPDPVVPPTPTGRITAAGFTLVGGWRIPQEFARGGLAIDWVNRRAYSGGHSQQTEIHEYELPEIGSGQEVSGWPILKRIATHQNFWGRGYAGGLRFADGVLWVSNRVHYDTAPTNLTLFGKVLATGEIITHPTTLRMPMFGGGFIKGHTEPLIGCGGYESGTGSASGPTCAKLDSTILLNQFGHGTLNWDQREKRPDNYSVASDSWVGLVPRNGEGRWASDAVNSGGVWLPSGLCYWVRLGTGLLDYKLQTECFAERGMVENWLYTYDPQAFNEVAFERWNHGKIHGNEITPDGQVCLLAANQWRVGQYDTGSVIKVFEVSQ